jgi:hypothetical protein
MQQLEAHPQFNPQIKFTEDQVPATSKKVDKKEEQEEKENVDDEDEGGLGFEAMEKAAAKKGRSSSDHSFCSIAFVLSCVKRDQRRRQKSNLRRNHLSTHDSSGQESLPSNS